MKYHTFIHPVLGLALLSTAVAACGDDAMDTETTSTTSTTTTTAGTTTTMGTTTDNPTMGTTTEDPTTEGPTSSSTDPSTSSTTSPGGGYNFPKDPFDAYTQIDRHGAVEAGTAGILAKEGLGFNMGSNIDLRNDYNASNPEEDAAGMWVPEIAKSVMFFHASFDDDLMSLMLVPATFDETIAQAGPVIIPDTIKYDPTKPTGYPNGRALTDQVVDITLAAVLLKLGPNQPLTLFADLPLNPPANDVAFTKEFPYLAPPH